MSSRPRRSAAQKASVAITDMADRDNMSSSRTSRRAGDGKGLASVSRAGQGDREHTYLNVKLPASKLRQATTNRHATSISVNNASGPKRPTRAGKKNYVVDDSDEDEDEEEGEDEIQVGAPVAMEEDDEDEDEEMDDADADADADADEDEDEDADGDVIEDEMDLDAEGEDDEDAEGEEDVDIPPVQPAPIIKISKPAKTSPSSKKTKQIISKKTAAQIASITANNSDDDELSDLDSDDEDLNLGDEDAEGEEEDEDMDAEGEEIEDEQDAEGEADADITGLPAAAPLDSDEDGSQTPDLSKMTQRQRARFEGLDESHYQALSNEVQAKKTFTVEEKAMRRAEMARRRRNLSEKRNEEVKQETINKLLKKQASKTNRKSLAAIGEEGQEMGEDGVMRANPIFIRWVSNSTGNRIAVPAEMMEGPAGQLFTKAVRPSSGKMVQEVL